MNSAAVAYADIFDYPLTESELNRWLIKGDSFASAKVSPYCERTDGFWHLPGRSKIISLRRRRLHFSQLKWPIAQQAAKILKFIPSIKLVAVTGALAMNNAGKNEDIDLMIITAANRLWLTRLLSLLLLFPFLRRGSRINNRLCLNLFLDESALVLNQQNLYTAHELCQLKPLYNRDQTYQKFISANLWYKRFLPNWKPALQGPTLKDKSEKRSDLIGILEFLAFKFQYFYMKPKMTRERVGPHFAFFHPRPTGEIVLQKYQQRLQGRSLTGDSAESRVGTAKLEGASLTERIILVTGVFDILHSEHKKLLSAAKKLGGILLVGIETDARVRRLKGLGRPVNSLSLRLKNLRRLRIADQVFALPKQFNDLNHFTALINQIRPDILAVSSSTPHLAVKRRIMNRFGGRVVIVLPHNPRVSTTKMLKSKDD